MLDPASWLEQAQALAEGKQARVAHDCGAPSMVVRHKVGGWSAYCYRCHDDGWVPKPRPTLQEWAARRALLRAAEEEIRHDPRPPYPAEFDPRRWPSKAAVWLYKAGLFVHNIQELGAYWNERLQRVVLPVVQEGRVVYWQARNVGLCDGPKYLGPARLAGVIPEYGGGGPVVLTEDILSAYRVGMAARGVAVLGTELSTPLLNRLLAERPPLLLWLDPDPAGERATREIGKQLTLVGLPYGVVSSRKDPKNHSRAEVAQYIKRASHERS